MMRLDSKPRVRRTRATHMDLLPFYFDDDIIEFGFVAIHGGLAAAEAPLNYSGFAVAGRWWVAFVAGDVGVHVVQENDYARALVDDGAFFAEAEVDIDDADAIIFK